MKKHINLFILLLLLLSTACVTLKPANNPDKAESKIIKFNTGIQNQIDRFPQLINKAFTVTKYDTVYFPEQSSEFRIALFKIDSLEKITKQYQEFILQRNYQIDSLLNVPLKDYPKECQFIVDDLNKRISLLRQELNLRNLKSQELYNKYQAILTTRVQGFYEDSIFHVDYDYYNGEVIVKPTVKEQFKVVPVEINDFNIKAKKHFYQDFKFWIFLTLLLLIFYFFKDLVYNILDSIFTSIIKLFRKLLIKI